MSRADHPLSGPEAPPVSILFVDDELAILRLLKRMLASSSFEVLIASSAREAIALLAQRPVDVLVSDIDMPGMSGLELVQIARREHPKMLRMLLTATGTLERAVNAINEGEVVRFFVKPFRVDLFRATLEGFADHIERARRTGDASGRSVRRHQLERWIEERFPGTLAIEPTPSCIEVDLDALGVALEAVNLPGLARGLTVQDSAHVK